MDESENFLKIKKKNRQILFLADIEYCCLNAYSLIFYPRTTKIIFFIHIYSKKIAAVSTIRLLHISFLFIKYFHCLVFALMSTLPYDLVMSLFSSQNPGTNNKLDIATVAFP